MLNKTRKGSHAEYLANYYMSLLGFTAPVPRQEDYGIDIFCCLATENEHQFLQDEPFVIQVKSSFENLLFGKKKSGWNKHQINFLFNLKTPFFLGIVNLEDDSLSIYPISIIWFLKKQHSQCSQIEFKFDRQPGESIHHIPDSKKKIRNWKDKGGDGYRYTCDLKKPLMKITSNDLKSIENRELFRRIFRLVIKMEQVTLIFNEMNWPHFYWPYRYSTNSEDIEFKWIHYDDEPNISNPKVILEKSGQFLVALALSFKLHGMEHEYRSLCEITKTLPEFHKFEPLWTKHPELNGDKPS